MTDCSNRDRYVEGRYATPAVADHIDLYSRELRLLGAVFARADEGLTDHHMGRPLDFRFGFTSGTQLLGATMSAAHVQYVFKPNPGVDAYGGAMRAFVIAALLALVLPANAGEYLSGTNVDVRTTIAFKVSDAAVQKMVPEGWEISSPSAGPFKGFNLAVVLIDSISALDADAKPVAPFHGVVLAIPARKKGTETAVTTVVYGIAARELVPGAYGVYVSGQIAIERKVCFAADGTATTDETWVFGAQDGSSIDARFQYERGDTTRSKAEAKIYSGAKPEFFRIYRWDQVADVVRSTATGVDRVTRYSFKASGSKLASLFDGSEQLVGVMSIPSYSRAVFLPD